MTSGPRRPEQDGSPRFVLALVALQLALVVAVLAGGYRAQITPVAPEKVAASTVPPKMAPPSTPPRNQIEIGMTVFLVYCAKCHGQHGEGYIARALVAARDPLAGYRTADNIFAYVSRAMPGDHPGSLTEQQYWDVIAFLLDANGVLPKGAQVSKDNAKMVKTTKP